mgnify:CR=1 FL=1
MSTDRVKAFLEFKALYQKAHQAGMAALEACTPRPMVVEQHKNMADDRSPVVEQYYVPQGVCGFAWVKVRPATSAFARWAKGQKLASTDGYADGLVFWVREGGQSMELKEAYAWAFAEVLRGAGLDAYAQSRID